MLRPDQLPRTLVGAGGIRLIDMPGVIYPPEVILGRKDWNRRSGRPYTKVPDWGISSREAAGLLQCTVSAARATLARHRVRHRKVQGEDKVMRLYWKKDQVLALVQSRAPVTEAPSNKLIEVPEAVQILGVARSSLYRYVQKGRLKEVKLRFLSPTRGLKLRSYFIRAEVVKLAGYLRMVREKERELHCLRCHQNAGSRKDAPRS